MLPSHLLDPTKKKNEPLSHTRLGQAPPRPLPSLCVTGALSQIGRCTAGPGVTLVYCIFRPRQLHDTRRPPLVVLHGGPSIPSNYLLPLVNGVTDRTVIFYDQFGCGKSSRPSNDKQPFSIDLMVKHLKLLITEQWGLQKYHLFGHSWGGILAYEYLVSLSEPSDRAACQSLILASAPTSAQLVQEESKILYRKVNGLSEKENEETEDDDDDDTAPRRNRQHAEIFHQTHECRLPQPPLAFIDAMAQAGPPTWRGIPAISSYHAQHPLSNVPPTLLVRGQFDFCTEKCMEGWKDLLDPTPTSKTLINCSHYGMLEDEQQYGKVITEFLLQHDTSA